MVEEILLRLLRSDAAAVVRAGAGVSDASRILESMQFMRAHHMRPLNLEQLARQVAMSSSHFAHRFRALARISPMHYLREVRLDQARTRFVTLHDLLTQRGRTTTKAAMQWPRAPAP